MISDEIDCEELLADGLAKAFYDSLKNGSVLLMPGSVAGGCIAPAGAFVSLAPAELVWDGTYVQCKDMIHDALTDEDMSNYQKWTAIADAAHSMAVSGQLTGRAVGQVTTPAVPPVVIPGIIVDLQGAFIGVSEVLGAAFALVDSLEGNDLIAGAMGTAFKAYCLLLNCSVSGLPFEPGIAGYGMGFVAF